MGKRKMTQYAQEFKPSSANLANESEKPITETAKDFGINKTTPHGWVKKYHPTRKQEISIEAKPELEQEVKRLRRENTRLKQERDILKKATAYFASDQL
jgi:transposase